MFIFGRYVMPVKLISFSSRSALAMANTFLPKRFLNKRFKSSSISADVKYQLTR